LLLGLAAKAEVSFACIYSQRQIGKGEVSYEGHGIHESKEKIPVREIGISF
jgi:hypothetical protein